MNSPLVLLMALDFLYFPVDLFDCLCILVLSQLIDEVHHLDAIFQINVLIAIFECVKGVIEWMG